MSIERRMANRHQSMALGDCHQYHEQGAPRSLALRINAGAWVNRGYFCNPPKSKPAKGLWPDPSNHRLNRLSSGTPRPRREFRRDYVPPIPSRSPIFAQKTPI